MVAYPNPFASNATIKFVLSESTHYILHLYDSRGTEVRILKKGKGVAGEEITATLNGTTLSNGLYIVRLQTTKESKTIKVLLQK
jgi:hypothetical protein